MCPLALTVKRTLFPVNGRFRGLAEGGIRSGRIDRSAKPSRHRNAVDERRLAVCLTLAAFPLHQKFLHPRIPRQRSSHADDSTHVVLVAASRGLGRSSCSPERRSLRSLAFTFSLLPAATPTIDFPFQTPKPFQIFVVPKPSSPPVHNLQLWRPYVAVSYPALKGHRRYANGLSRVPRTNGHFHI